MKKIALGAVLFLSSGALWALPVGNPAEASLLREGVFWKGNEQVGFWDFWCNPCKNWCNAFHFRLGFYGDYVYGHSFERQGNGIINNVPKDIEHTQIETNAALFVINFFNCFDFFATLGASNLNMQTNAITFDGETLRGDRLDIESVTELSWSVGGRWTVWRCGCTTIGIEGQYFQFSPDVKRIQVAELAAIYPDTAGIDFEYSEWQLGIGITHRIGYLLPYAALKWSGSKFDAHDAVVTWVGDPSSTQYTINLHDLESKKVWGYALGVTLIGCQQAGVTAEARFGDEKALHVNGQFRF